VNKCWIAFVTCILAGLAALPGIAAADDAEPYPSRPVRLIIPSSASGGTDYVARALAQRLSEVWKRPVVPENHGGAGGLIGLELVARAAPDGYTLTAFNVGQIVAAQIAGKLDFGRDGDFTPIARTATAPQVLVVATTLPAKSVKELVELARAKPNDLNYGSTGQGGTTHLAMEAIQALAGVKMTHIPYQGTGPVIPDLLAGRVQVAMASPPSVTQLVREGRLRALAITGAKRASALPEVPTFAEAGYPTYDMSTWFGVFGPAKMPPALVAKINAAVTLAMEPPELAARFEKTGIDVASGLTPPQVADYMTIEAAKWDAAAKAAGFR
jgi:tripartite-type tricarboxylate transporter receptor subunit TctC